MRRQLSQLNRLGLDSKCNGLDHTAPTQTCITVVKLSIFVPHDRSLGKFIVLYQSFSNMLLFFLFSKESTYSYLLAGPRRRLLHLTKANINKTVGAVDKQWQVAL